MCSQLPITYSLAPVSRLRAVPRLARFPADCITAYIPSPPVISRHSSRRHVKLPHSYDTTCCASFGLTKIEAHFRTSDCPKLFAGLSLKYSITTPRLPEVGCTRTSNALKIEYCIPPTSQNLPIPACRERWTRLRLSPRLSWPPRSLCCPYRR